MVEDFNTSVGRRIKERRIAAGLTQKEFAYKLGVMREVVSYIENGRRSATAAEIVNIAEILGTNTDYLLTGIETRYLGAGEATGLSNEALANLQRLSHINKEEADSFFPDEYINAVDFMLSHQQGIEIITAIYQNLMMNYKYACHVRDLGKRDKAFPVSDICFISGRDMEGHILDNGFTSMDFEKLALLRIMDSIISWKRDLLKEERER